MPGLQGRSDSVSDGHTSYAYQLHTVLVEETAIAKAVVGTREDRCLRARRR